MTKLKHISQDHNGQYLHKALYEYNDGRFMIATAPIIPEEGGCWTCMTEIHFYETVFEVDGLHPKHGVLLYKERRKTG